MKMVDINDVQAFCEALDIVHQKYTSNSSQLMPTTHPEDSETELETSEHLGTPPLLQPHPEDSESESEYETSEHLGTPSLLYAREPGLATSSGGGKGYKTPAFSKSSGLREYLAPQDADASQLEGMTYASTAAPTSVYVNRNIMGAPSAVDYFNDEPDLEVAKPVGQKDDRTNVHKLEKQERPISEKPKPPFYRNLGLCVMLIVIVLLVWILGVLMAGNRREDTTVILGTGDAVAAGGVENDQGASVTSAKGEVEENTKDPPVRPEEQQEEDATIPSKKDPTDPPFQEEDTTTVPAVDPTPSPVAESKCPYAPSDEHPSEAFLSTGCFQDAMAMEQHPLACSSKDLRALECSERCLTRFFGVTGSSCKCFSDVPSTRIGIGACEDRRALQSNTANTRKMELYFNLRTSTECPSDTSRTVRDELSKGDNTPFGFDIIRNTFTKSPFELFDDECGTNLYEVYTDVSEDSESFKTDVKSVTEFATERKQERKASLSFKAEAEANIKAVEVSAKVSASMDLELTDLLKSSGAQEKGSKVFRTYATKRVARVEIIDFENQKSLVTFSAAFASRLKSYAENGFRKEDAFSILAAYGQFVVTRGIFGGYMERRMAIKSSSLRTSSLEESQFKLCFQASVGGKVGAAGVSVSTDQSGSGCNDKQKSDLRKAFDTFSQEYSGESAKGGRLEGDCSGDSESCKFVVEAGTATLLTTKDKYPQGDKGVQFRPLSDFLHPSKVSPLEVKRWHITEEQFGEIHRKFEQHTFDYLNRVAGILDDCSDCELENMVYLVEDTSVPAGLGCECYDPKDPPPPPPSPHPTPAPTFGPSCDAEKPHAGFINTDISAELVLGDGENCGDTWSPTLGICYSSGDFKRYQKYEAHTQGKWYRVDVKNKNCGNSDPATNDKVENKVRLTSPSGVNYDLYVYIDTYSNLYESSTEGSGQVDEVVVRKHNKGGVDDSFTYWIKVQYVEGQSCVPWRLEILDHNC